MKAIPTLVAPAVLIGCLLIDCQSTQPAFRPPASAAQATENNCLALLHQLLDDQKDVSVLRYIKREHSDVKALVKKVATTSGTGSKLLEEFARKDPSLNLDATLLPPGESATRDAIASTKKKELLGHTGDEFELMLLLTQTEALSYAWHLAQVASENDPRADRAHALAGLSEDMKNLYHEVFELLLSEEDHPQQNTQRLNGNP